MFRRKPGEEAGATHGPEEPSERAPAVREKLNCALGALAELEEQVAEYALEAAERKAGAADKLAGHRAKIEAAKTAADELAAALRLAERLDRQALAAGAAEMRAEQLTEFKKEFAAREKAMGTVLEAAAAMAKAYGEYSEATLRALAATPTGTMIPAMFMGPENSYGPAFGPGERMVLAELYRLSPERLDGAGRFVLPFAKPSSEMVRNKPEEMPAGMDELCAAHAAIIDNVALQIDRLDERAMQAAQTTTDRKAAA
ncbi:hypothetical protein M2171_004938 [Bradyrhizobium japonicum USDA 38]|uniref:hypothetical protein n=1 Tax=Bradyrhizobium japonicum TaxID=375 RepID=UPI000401813F|nr:hypothetical protein [Bradyrhizobium japonicum]MCS3895805.1 hypothetical protein [Bradyrhizobium japonicum USDA 38]MCS3948320.1 hypothetical protein [Bradyrhizobium japonicum]